MTEQQENNLEEYDRLWKYFNEFSGTPEQNIDDLQNEIPDVLRFLADDMREHSPHAKRDISILEECADFLDGLDLTSNEDYWERRERLDDNLEDDN